MPAYLGNLGSLFAVECEAAAVEATSGYTFESSLEGTRKAQFRHRRPRGWEIEMGLSSSTETANVRALDAGEFGIGPFVWCTEEAQATNMLTPEQSTCDPSTLYTSGVTVGGPLDLGADGIAGRKFVNATPGNAFYFDDQKIPVRPSQPVTASAYLVGAGAGIRIAWYDAAGTFLTSTTGAGAGVAGSAKRVSHTATPPAAAASALVVAVNASEGARPALTWTSSLAAWAPGGGCPKAVVSKLENAPAVLGETQSYGQVKFTVTEVG
ncbi:hypothetical protein V1638_04255 [Pseudarthrobacter sp. J64]|uniref:hypothetical protein n=1 Tax=Pseudarthrobacter sp. J64 TaxID=3116485 RepID=UPI002E8049B8|nr:hypothetical protein [Pseudarthrobacter sp. J64]MEE2568609.1 hypothetical protein [Pseudarthrobacter sp. J64]